MPQVKPGMNAPQQGLGLNPLHQIGRGLLAMAGLMGGGQGSYLNSPQGPYGPMGAGGYDPSKYMPPQQAAPAPDQGSYIDSPQGPYGPMGTGAYDPSKYMPPQQGSMGDRPADASLMPQQQGISPQAIQSAIQTWMQQAQGGQQQQPQFLSGFRGDHPMMPGGGK